jgi:hypothetical protein
MHHEILQIEIAKKNPSVKIGSTELNDKLIDGNVL